MILNRGYIHVYYGTGKGKTTAATGLAARALGAGGRVFLGRFLKGRDSGELDCLSKWDSFHYESFGSEDFIVGTPSTEDHQASRAGFDRAKEALDSGEWDMVILDEILYAVRLGLFTEEELISLLSRKKTCTELVLTGGYTFPELENAADLVTEMREVKHYFRNGVPARKGIED